MNETEVNYQLHVVYHDDAWNVRISIDILKKCVGPIEKMHSFDTPFFQTRQYRHIPFISTIVPAIYTIYITFMKVFTTVQS